MGADQDELEKAIDMHIEQLALLKQKHARSKFYQNFNLEDIRHHADAASRLASEIYKKRTGRSL